MQIRLLKDKIIDQFISSFGTADSLIDCNLFLEAVIRSSQELTLDEHFNVESDAHVIIRDR